MSMEDEVTTAKAVSDEELTHTSESIATVMGVSHSHTRSTSNHVDVKSVASFWLVEVGHHWGGFAAITKVACVSREKRLSSGISSSTMLCVPKLVFAAWQPAAHKSSMLASESGP